MSYVLNRTMSLSGLRSYAVGVLAGLGAAGLADIAALWQTFLGAVSAAITGQTADEDAELLTTARVRLCDRDWDKSVAELSKKALFLAGGAPEASPYASLFGTIKMRDLVVLGPAKASVAAGELLTKIGKLNESRLAAEAQDLAAKTEALSVAERADAAAEMKLSAHSVERTQLLRQANTLIAETEAKLMILHPGDVELVRAILNPKRPARRTRVTESDEPGETTADPEALTD